MNSESLSRHANSTHYGTNTEFAGSVDALVTAGEHETSLFYLKRILSKVSSRRRSDFMLPLYCNSDGHIPVESLPSAVSASLKFQMSSYDSDSMISTMILLRKHLVERLVMQKPSFAECDAFKSALFSGSNIDLVLDVLWDVARKDCMQIAVTLLNVKRTDLPLRPFRPPLMLHNVVVDVIHVLVVSCVDRWQLASCCRVAVYALSSFPPPTHLRILRVIELIDSRQLAMCVNINSSSDRNPSVVRAVDLLMDAQFVDLLASVTFQCSAASAPGKLEEAKLLKGIVSSLTASNRVHHFIHSALCAIATGPAKQKSRAGLLLLERFPKLLGHLVIANKNTQSAGTRRAGIPELDDQAHGYQTHWFIDDKIDHGYEDKCKYCQKKIVGFGIKCYGCDTSSYHVDCAKVGKLKQDKGRKTAVSNFPAVPSIMRLYQQVYINGIPAPIVRTGGHQLSLFNVFCTLKCQVCKLPVLGPWPDIYRCGLCELICHTSCQLNIKPGTCGSASNDPAYHQIEPAKFVNHINSYFGYALKALSGSRLSKGPQWRSSVEASIVYSVLLCQEAMIYAGFKEGTIKLPDSAPIDNRDALARLCPEFVEVLGNLAVKKLAPILFSKSEVILLFHQFKLWLSSKKSDESMPQRNSQLFAASLSSSGDDRPRIPKYDVSAPLETVYRNCFDANDFFAWTSKILKWEFRASAELLFHQWANMGVVLCASSNFSNELEVDDCIVYLPTFVDPSFSLMLDGITSCMKASNDLFLNELGWVMLCRTYESFKHVSSLKQLSVEQEQISLTNRRLISIALDWAVEYGDNFDPSMGALLDPSALVDFAQFKELFVGKTFAKIMQDHHRVYSELVWNLIEARKDIRDVQSLVHLLKRLRFLSLNSSEVTCKILDIILEHAQARSEEIPWANLLSEEKAIIVEMSMEGTPDPFSALVLGHSGLSGNSSENQLSAVNSLGTIQSARADNVDFMGDILSQFKTWKVGGRFLNGTESRETRIFSYLNMVETAGISISMTFLSTFMELICDCSGSETASLQHINLLLQIVLRKCLLFDKAVTGNTIFEILELGLPAGIKAGSAILNLPGNVRNGVDRIAVNTELLLFVRNSLSLLLYCSGCPGLQILELSSDISNLKMGSMEFNSCPAPLESDEIGESYVLLMQFLCRPTSLILHVKEGANSMFTDLRLELFLIYNYFDVDFALQKRFPTFLSASSADISSMIMQLLLCPLKRHQMHEVLVGLVCILSDSCANDGFRQNKGFEFSHFHCSLYKMSCSVDWVERMRAMEIIFALVRNIDSDLFDFYLMSWWSFGVIFASVIDHLYDENESIRVKTAFQFRSLDGTSLKLMLKSISDFLESFSNIRPKVVVVKQLIMLNSSFQSLAVCEWSLLSQLMQCAPSHADLNPINFTNVRGAAYSAASLSHAQNLRDLAVALTLQLLARGIEINGKELEVLISGTIKLFQEDQSSTVDADMLAQQFKKTATICLHGLKHVFDSYAINLRDDTSKIAVEVTESSSSDPQGGNMEFFRAIGLMGKRVVGDLLSGEPERVNEDITSRHSDLPDAAMSMLFEVLVSIISSSRVDSLDCIQLKSWLEAASIFFYKCDVDRLDYFNRVPALVRNVIGIACGGTLNDSCHSEVFKLLHILCSHEKKLPMEVMSVIVQYGCWIICQLRDNGAHPLKNRARQFLISLCDSYGDSGLFIFLFRDKELNGGLVPVSKDDVEYPFFKALVTSSRLERKDDARNIADIVLGDLFAKIFMLPDVNGETISILFESLSKYLAMQNAVVNDRITLQRLIQFLEDASEKQFSWKKREWNLSAVLNCVSSLMVKNLRFLKTIWPRCIAFFAFGIRNCIVERLAVLTFLNACKTISKDADEKLSEAVSCLVVELCASLRSGFKSPETTLALLEILECYLCASSSKTRVTKVPALEENSLASLDIQTELNTFLSLDFSLPFSRITLDIYDKIFRILVYRHLEMGLPPDWSFVGTCKDNLIKLSVYLPWISTILIEASTTYKLGVVATDLAELGRAAMKCLQLSIESQSVDIVIDMSDAAAERKSKRDRRNAADRATLEDEHYNSESGEEDDEGSDAAPLSPVDKTANKPSQNRSSRGNRSIQKLSILSVKAWIALSNIARCHDVQLCDVQELQGNYVYDTLWLLMLPRLFGETADHMYSEGAMSMWASMLDIVMFSVAVGEQCTFVLISLDEVLSRNKAKLLTNPMLAKRIDHYEEMRRSKFPTVLSERAIIRELRFEHEKTVLNK